MVADPQMKIPFWNPPPTVGRSLQGVHCRAFTTERSTGILSVFTKKLTINECFTWAMKTRKFEQWELFEGNVLWVWELHGHGRRWCMHTPWDNSHDQPRANHAYSKHADANHARRQLLTLQIRGLAKRTDEKKRKKEKLICIMMEDNSMSPLTVVSKTNSFELWWGRKVVLSGKSLANRLEINLASTRARQRRRQCSDDHLSFFLQTQQVPEAFIRNQWLMKEWKQIEYPDTRIRETRKISHTQDNLLTIFFVRISRAAMFVIYYTVIPSPFTLLRLSPTSISFTSSDVPSSLPSTNRSFPLQTHEESGQDGPLLVPLTSQNERTWFLVCLRVWTVYASVHGFSRPCETDTFLTRGANNGVCCTTKQTFYSETLPLWPRRKDSWPIRTLETQISTCFFGISRKRLEREY